jgi:SlyX protein
VETEERINDLQSRLAFQDDNVQAPGRCALAAQQRVMERLQPQVAALIKRQDESAQFVRLSTRRRRL